MQVRSKKTRKLLKNCNDIWEKLWVSNFATVLSLRDLFVYSTINSVSDQRFP